MPIENDPNLDLDRDDAKEKDETEYSPLIQAVIEGNATKFVTILSLCPYFKYTTSYGWNVLHYIAKFNRHEFFDIIQEKDLKSTLELLVCVTASGQSALDIAAANGHLEMLQRVVAHAKHMPATPNLISALNFAIEGDYENCVKFLIQIKPNVLCEIDPESSDTILHKIAIFNAVKTYKMLVNSYTTLIYNLLKTRNQEELTPMELAKEYGRYDLCCSIAGLGGIDSLQTLASLVSLPETDDGSSPFDSILLPASSPATLSTLYGLKQFKEQWGDDYRSATAYACNIEQIGRIWTR